MEIRIEQHAISFGSTYDIYIDDHFELSARRQVYSFLFDEIKLKKLYVDEPILRIKKNSFFLAEYFIITANQNKYLFDTKNLIRSHFICKIEDNQYDIYGHRGNKFSVFLGGSQIAWWNKNLIPLMKEDKYKIIANHDVDITFIIAFCLIIDNYKYEHKTNSFNATIGSLGLFDKEFDESWEPTIEKHDNDE
jgi:hypothetical protein